MLRLDYVYMRLNDPPAVRVARAVASSATPEAVRAAVEASLDAEALPWPATIKCTIGGAEVAMIPIQLGLQGTFGVIVAGTQRETFPEETEKLLINVAANQAAMALKEARLLSELKAVAEELDRRVAQRTTELSSANEALRREVAERESSEARKAAVFTSALDCVVTIDHHGRITEFNPAAELTFGYRQTDVIGLPLADAIIPPSLREQHRLGFARYLASGESAILGKRLELTAMRADGSEFPVELAITRIPLPGPPSFTGYLRDVTEQRSSAAALDKLRAELTAAARLSTLAALTASIAHEVNQPLTGAITNTGTALRVLGMEPPNLAVAQDTMQRALRDGRRAADVIARLRALFANVDSASEVFEINEATQEVLALSMGDLQAGGVTLQLELDEGLPAIVGDRVQLQQVIRNLVQNASDAMNEIEDRPRTILVRTELDGDAGVRLTVRDSGVGLDPEGISKLFDAFYTTKKSGMGIGLFVSRTIVESHGGRIWAVANDGPGSSVCFSIPLRGEELNAEAANG
jgi:PAS domain S-box-containing protein